tara:strand:- start:1572 stop:2054 length:483 start_codon:yes stop_codon:yes gene_type:complete
MLQELSKHNNELLLMAKKFDSNNFQDLLQDTYLKLYDSAKKFNEIDLGYIYMTMRSIYIDGFRKNKEIPFEDFSNLYLIEEEYTEREPLDLSVLTGAEKQLYYSYFGKKITNYKNEIIGEIDGANLSKISRETGIPYRTIYTRFQRLKLKLCKDLATVSK